MVVQPNSTIKIYKGIPLDNTYNHTLYFADISSQTAYFMNTFFSKIYSFANQSYTRVNKNKIRIEKSADDLYDCNYLAFQNTSFGNKWFYAFITEVEYINNETSEVSFEIDVMQTYMFDVAVKECFVEREHSATDNVGDNIQPEPVALGEMVDDSDNNHIGSEYGQNLVFVMKSADSNHQGNVYDNVFSGCQIRVFEATDGAGIANYIDQFMSQPDEIVNIYMVPRCLLPFSQPIPTGGQPLGGNTLAAGQQLTITTLNPTADFDNYTPKNKKLYTYPYNFVRIDNNSGQSLNLRYEFFPYGQVQVQIVGCLTPPVKLVLRPYNYKNRLNQASKSESITLDGYPVCSWNIDAYKQWMAQNSVPIGLSAVSGVATSAIASIFSAHPIGALATGIIGTVAGVLSQQYEASIAADQCRGNIANGNVNFSRNDQNFYYTRTHVTADFAKTIDDFFTMFGYATNKVKVPNIHVRERWTYTKTVGCVVVGNAPAESVKKICNIYDSGVTFWVPSATVGDYSASNNVLT